MEEYTIHSIGFSTEAKFDYALIFNLLVGDFGSDLPPNFRLDNNIRKELEFYITINKKVWYKKYFRATYIHEETGKTLMFFIKQRQKFSTMQIWEVVGICEAFDYDEELEECGQIRAWYETKIDMLPYEVDWVEEKYRNKMLEQLDLIYDIGGRDGYIRCCEELIAELSSKFKQDKISKLTVRGVKPFIKGKSWTSETANAIIGILDELYERERERSDNFDL